MTIMDFIFCLDLFGDYPRLRINEKPQMRTCLGLIVSLLTYILFILILLYELQEVIHKQNPNIITNKFDSEFYPGSFPFNENTFKLILAPNDEILAKYFKLDGSLIYQIDEQIITMKKLTFSKCETEELDEDYKNHFKKKNVTKTPLCLRNLYSNEYENLAPKFNLLIYINFKECSEYDETCTYNQTIYDEIRGGKYTFGYSSYFKNYMLNVFNNDKPFFSHIKEDNFKLSEKATNVEYSFDSVNELVSNENYIFNHSKKESHFDLLTIKYAMKKNKLELTKTSILFNIKCNSIKVTVRNYKGLLTAIANSFSLIRLALYVIKKSVKCHIKYSIEEVIIAKNFYFEKPEAFSAINNTCRENSLKITERSLIYKKPVIKLIQAESSLKPVIKLIQAESSLKPASRGKLTLKDICLNITCLRYFLCRKKNKTFQFYNEVQKVINKYLSAENLLYCLIELKRLKSETNHNENSIDLISGNESIKIGYELEHDGSVDEGSINQD
jgi:hypothetical protein